MLVTNETADATVAFAAAQWTDVETSSFRAEVAGDFASIGLPDVKDAATAALVFGADNGGGLHVVYDADAKIIADILWCSIERARDRQSRMGRRGHRDDHRRLGHH